MGAGTSKISCTRFLLHKSCAELPERFQNLTNPNGLFHLCFDFHNHAELWIRPLLSRIMECDICHIQIPWSPKQFFYYRRSLNSCICLNCVIFQTQTPLADPISIHPSHNQHLLSFIQDQSSFKCYACNVDDNIRHQSYRCTRCRFWIHKSCADAPMSFQFQFHKHPLVLLFSLPPVYHKFGRFCGLCNKKLSQLVWIYYCSNGRFFAHFQCARSHRLMRYLIRVNINILCPCLFSRSNFCFWLMPFLVCVNKQKHFLESENASFSLRASASFPNSFLTYLLLTSNPLLYFKQRITFFKLGQTAPHVIFFLIYNTFYGFS